MSLLPVLLLIAVWIYFMRAQTGGGKGGAFSFGKSRARLLDKDANTVKFSDVAGCDEAKEEVQEIVDYLKAPIAINLWADVCHAVFCWQAALVRVKPCWQKRLQAKRACHFSAFRVRILWKCLWAWAQAACAICLNKPRKTRLVSFFIDEIDAVGRQRGAGWAVAMTNANKP